MKRSTFLLVFVSLVMTTMGQIDNSNRLLDECYRLYNDGKYGNALTLMKDIETDGLDATEKQELELLKAITTFEENHLEGRALILQYLDDYPESSKRELLGCYIAESYYHGKDFEMACKWFEQNNIKRLPRVQQERATLYYALSLQECGNEENAVNILRNIVVKSKKYADDAIFHLAVIDYDNDELENAERGFKSVKNSRKYKYDVPYFIAGIHLKRGENEEANEIAKNFIIQNGKKKQQIARMLQISGAAKYAQGNYEDAITPLTRYIEKSEKPQRIACYQLGMCHFKNGDFDKALPLFVMCNDGDDAVAQSSLLHTGIIMLDKKDENGARISFELASAMTHDNKVREEAMYNYALCLHRTRYSPFAESVKIFELFLNDYPQSEHAKKVEGYLVEVYMNTHNYDVALQSINKIKSPSAEILKAKQKILYRLGVQEFINGNMNGAISFMDRSIELSRYNKATHADALYWKGEALYRKGNYSKAANSYLLSMAEGGVNDNHAQYGIGYTLFQQKRYSEARKAFTTFINMSVGENKGTVADALNRIADCFFYQREYKDADRNYKMSIATDSSACDYPLYRSALAQGLSDNYEEKVNTLKTLLEKYPNSVYAEKAFYEMGRAYLELEQPENAITTFDRLTVRFPKSSLTRRATTEKAMVYNSIGERDKAIDTYKEIIERYPHSEEAQVAFQDLKNIYVDMGEVNEFAQYANTTGNKSINKNEMDTLSYTAAEKIYGKGEITGAKEKFEEYISGYEKGVYRLNAHYYLGEIYYDEKNIDKALEHFEEVLKFSDNKYTELSIIRAAGIIYNKERYEEAGDLYKQLLAKSSNEERRQLARTNIMRTAQKLDKYGEIVKYAGELMANSNTSPEVKREAGYNRAKAYLAMSKEDAAVKDLKELASDTRTKEGAEAKYLLAQIEFDQEKYDDCENTIMEYINESTPHAYWLARSFVLLSDLYSTQGKKMEAKQYLLSLQNNYEGEDDIAEMIERRLEILNKENEQHN